MKRPSDMVARYGGEEFAVILPMTDLAGATVVTHQLRRAVEGLAVPHAGSEFSVVTLSIGIAEWRPGTEDLSAQLVESADQALYRAKRAGRNRVVTSEQALAAGALSPTAQVQVKQRQTMGVG